MTQEQLQAMAADLPARGDGVIPLAVVHVHARWQADGEDWAWLSLIQVIGGETAPINEIDSAIAIARRYGHGGIEAPEFGVVAALKCYLQQQGATVLKMELVRSQQKAGAYTFVYQVLVGAKAAVWWAPLPAGGMALRGC